MPNEFPPHVPPHVPDTPLFTMMLLSTVQLLKPQELFSSLMMIPPALLKTVLFEIVPGVQSVIEAYCFVMAHPPEPPEIMLFVSVSAAPSA